MTAKAMKDVRKTLSANRRSSGERLRMSHAEIRTSATFSDGVNRSAGCMWTISVIAVAWAAKPRLRYSASVIEARVADRREEPVATQMRARLRAGS